MRGHGRCRGVVDLADRRHHGVTIRTAQRLARAPTSDEPHEVPLAEGPGRRLTTWWPEGPLLRGSAADLASYVSPADLSQDAPLPCRRYSIYERADRKLSLRTRPNTSPAPSTATSISIVQGWGPPGVGG